MQYKHSPKTSTVHTHEHVYENVYARIIHSMVPLYWNNCYVTCVSHKT